MQDNLVWSRLIRYSYSSRQARSSRRSASRRNHQAMPDSSRDSDRQHYRLLYADIGRLSCRASVRPPPPAGSSPSAFRCAIGVLANCFNVFTSPKQLQAHCSGHFGYPPSDRSYSRDITHPELWLRNKSCCPTSSPVYHSTTKALKAEDRYCSQSPMSRLLILEGFHALQASFGAIDRRLPFDWH